MGIIYLLVVCLGNCLFFVENQSISYLLSLIAFINLILYLTQFVVYTKECVTKSFKSNENILSKEKKRLNKRCGYCLRFEANNNCILNALKILLTLSDELIISHKSTHRSINDLSPYQQEWLSKTFLNNKAKIWT